MESYFRRVPEVPADHVSVAPQPRRDRLIQNGAEAVGVQQDDRTTKTIPVEVKRGPAID